MVGGGGVYISSNLGVATSLFFMSDFGEIGPANDSLKTSGYESISG